MIDVAIVGLGLIGGSLALALRRAPGVRVTGIDRAEVLGTEAAAHAVDALISSDDTVAVERAVAAAHVTVLATPVSVIVSSLPGLLRHAQVLTDCGSTKRHIAEVAAREPRAGRYVPGHPMAGLPLGGLAHARADLFDGRTWLVCSEGSEPDARERVCELARRAGAVPVELPLALHDRAVAITSHLPQLLGSALLSLAHEAGALPAAGPAFERATRSAGGPDAIWRDILLTNADEIASAIDELTAELQRVAAGLRESEGRADAALALLERARRAR